jgi:hypothetical protein
MHADALHEGVGFPLQRLFTFDRMSQHGDLLAAFSATVSLEATIVADARQA